MKKKYLLLSILTLTVFFSCKEDVGKLSVTYQEATAVYGDMNEVRAQPINTPIEALVNPGKIFVTPEYIFLGEEEKGVHVVDNTNPSNPVMVNFINIPGNREFFVKDQFLYADSYYDLLKIDISNPQQVTLISRAEYVFQDEFKNDQGETLLGFTFKEITTEVETDSELFNELSNSTIIYRDFASNIIPKSAVPSSFAGNSNDQSGTVNRITWANGYVYMITNKNLAIINDNTSFNVVPANNDLFLEEDMETIFPYNNNLFVGSRSAMNIYSIESPENPQEVYTFDHATACDPVLPTDDVAYITLRTGDFSDCPGHTNALIVLDISDLSDPDEEQEISMKSPYGMTLFDNTLYVGEGANGLSIFDVSDREDPVLLEQIEGVTAYDVIKHPSEEGLLLIAGPDGLSQYEMSGNFDLSLKSRIEY